MLDASIVEMSPYTIEYRDRWLDIKIDGKVCIHTNGSGILDVGDIQYRPVGLMEMELASKESGESITWEVTDEKGLLPRNIVLDVSYKDIKLKITDYHCYGVQLLTNVGLTADLETDISDNLIHRLAVLAYFWMSSEVARSYHH